MWCYASLYAKILVTGRSHAVFRSRPIMESSANEGVDCKQLSNPLPLTRALSRSFAT